MANLHGNDEPALAYDLCASSSHPHLAPLAVWCLDGTRDHVLLAASNDALLLYSSGISLCGGMLFLFAVDGSYWPPWA